MRYNGEKMRKELRIQTETKRCSIFANAEEFGALGGLCRYITTVEAS